MICSKCNKPIEDGDLTPDTFNSEPTEHLLCPTPLEPAETHVKEKESAA